MDKGENKVINPDIFNDVKSFREEWIKTAMKSLLVTPEEKSSMVKRLESIFDGKYKSNKLTFYNSYRGEYFIEDALSFLKKLYSDLIISEAGSFYLRHEQFTSPTVHTLLLWRAKRLQYKSKMYEYQTLGNDILNNLYKNRQINEKLLMNIEYGLSINAVSRLYNQDVPQSTTIRGRSTISVSALSVEFMGGNLKLRTLEALISLIKNTLDEEYSQEEISLLKSSTIKPTAEQIIKDKYGDGAENQPWFNILVKKINNMSDIDRLKLHYKGNMYRAMELPMLVSLIGNILDDLNKNSEAFLTPYKLPECVKDRLRYWADSIAKLSNGVFWYGQYSPGKDMRKTIRTMTRNHILLIDTDSNMNYFGEGTNTIRNLFKENKLNNLSDEEAWLSITNLTNLVLFKSTESVLYRYCTHCNIPEDYKQYVAMKNEFIYDVFLLTSARKNYIARVLLEEGNLLKTPEIQFKGLGFIKSSFNAKVSKAIKRIVTDNIISLEPTSLKEVLHELMEIEAEFKKQASTQKEAIELFNIKKLKHNKEDLDPTDWRVIAVGLYNYIYADDELTSISAPSAFYIAKLNFRGNEESVKSKFPVEYKKIVEYYKSIDVIRYTTAVRNRLQALNNIFIKDKPADNPSASEIKEDNQTTDVKDNNPDEEKASTGKVNIEFTKEEYKRLKKTYVEIVIPRIKSVLNKMTKISKIKDITKLDVSNISDIMNVTRSDLRKELKALMIGETKNALLSTKDINNILKLVPTFNSVRTKFEDINKIALPLDVEIVPEFILEFPGIIKIDTLLAPVSESVGIISARNANTSFNVTNVLNFY